MLGLMIRDLLVQRKRLYVAVVYCILGPILFTSMGQAALSLVMAAVVYIVLLTAFAYDDKYKVDGTLVSLPISRSALVVVRYLEVPTLSVAALLLYMLVTSVLRSRYPGMFPTGWLFPSAGFFAASLMSGLYMPIIYRFGYVKARIFNLVVFLVFALLPTISMVGNHEGESGLLSWLAAASEGAAAALLAAGAAAILAVSCLISIQLYRRREF